MTQPASLRGPLWIGIAALIWASDTLVRYPASGVIDPWVIVLAENFVGLLVLIPFVFFSKKKDLFQFSPKDWVAVAVIGIGGAALGNLLFTAAIQAIGAAIPSLIQKIQPIVVVILAFVVLGEKAKTNLFPWSILAVISAVLVSLPGFDFHSTSDFQSYKKGLLYAVAAMVMWGISTIAGKYLLYRHRPLTAAFWRMLGGSLCMLLLTLSSGKKVPWPDLFSMNLLPSLIFMGAFAGSAAMWLYYAGLKQTLASVATFVELLYPLGGVILASFFFGGHLSFIQTMAGILLFFSVLLIAIPKTRLT